MATIGRRRAVVDAFGVQFAGRTAMLMWAFVHLAYLVGWGNRVGTTVRWAWTLAARKPPRTADQPGRRARAGEAGRHFGECRLAALE